MPADSPIADVAHVIQLSVAPVFLLTAVGTILSVLSARLSRIVDRSRVLAERLPSLSPPARGPVDRELALLLRRRRLVNIALTCSTCAALMVAGVIGSAFLGFLFRWSVAGAMGVLFILAMLFLVTALLLFLREVFIAATRVQIGPAAGALPALHPAHHGPAEADVHASVGPRRGREAPGRPGEEA